MVRLLCMKRVFLGIDLPQKIKIELEALKRKSGLVNLPLRLVEQENSHVNIRFFDELSDEQISQINVCIDNIVSPTRPFTVNIEGFLVFPNLLVPRVVALKVECKELMQLAGKILNAMENMPFIIPVEKKYSPHITLGRVKEQLTFDEKAIIQTIKFKDQFRVEVLHMFESILTTSGPIYKIIRSYHLRNDQS